MQVDCGWWYRSEVLVCKLIRVNWKCLLLNLLTSQACIFIIMPISIVNLLLIVESFLFFLFFFFFSFLICILMFNNGFSWMKFYDAGFTTKSLILTPLIMQVSTKLIFVYLWKRKTHILIMKSWRMQFMKRVHIQQVRGLLLILKVSLYVNNLITYSDFSFYFVQTCV